jgi:phage shock protein E
MNNKLILWVVAGAVVAGALFALITPAPAVKKSITSPELTQLQASGAWVVDVRTNSEYIDGHIPNSLNVPVDQLSQTAGGWDKSQPVIVYCATGARSAEAAAYLAGQGFKKVYDHGVSPNWARGGQDRRKTCIHRLRGKRLTGLHPDEASGREAQARVCGQGRVQAVRR